MYFIFIFWLYWLFLIYSYPLWRHSWETSTSLIWVSLFFQFYHNCVNHKMLFFIKIKGVYRATLHNTGKPNNIIIIGINYKIRTLNKICSNFNLYHCQYFLVYYVQLNTTSMLYFNLFSTQSDHKAMFVFI